LRETGWEKSGANGSRRERGFFIGSEPNKKGPVHGLMKENFRRQVAITMRSFTPTVSFTCPAYYLELSGFRMTGWLWQGAAGIKTVLGTRTALPAEGKTLQAAWL